MKPNSFPRVLSKALSSIGFSDRRVGDDDFTKATAVKTPQNSLIKVFQMAGYFQPKFLRQQSYLMDLDPKTKTHKDLWSCGVKASSEHLEDVAREAESRVDSTEFLMDNLFKSPFDDSFDASELVVRIGQSAFGRDVNIERNELVAKSWMESCKEEYLRNAEVIGLISEKTPSHKEYDEIWIMGAARFRVMDRVKYAKAMIDSGITCITLRLLTGERELWAEIDKISTIEEAKDYMLKLAKKNDIEVDKDNPFDVDRFKGRTYLRYAIGEERKVTETMMAKEIFYEVFAKAIEEIIDSKAESGMLRPITATNVADLLKGDFGKKMREKLVSKDKVKIAIVSNQPYCDRQAKTSEVEIYKFFKEILVEKGIELEGVGSKSTATVAQIHSELGALILEGYKLYLLRNRLESKRPLENLSYQTRCNDETLVPKIFGSVMAPKSQAMVDNSRSKDSSAKRG